MIFYDTQCSFVKHSSYSQDPKALAEDQRGWHQKFTQLVKQPLSCADDASSLSCQQGCQSGPGTFLGPEEPGSQGLWHQAMFAERLRKPIWRARARGASPHTSAKEVREPTNTAKTMVWTMFLQQASKQKLKIRIAKKQEPCILQCLWPAGHMRKGGSGAHKHSQNHGMDDVSPPT